MKKLFRPLQVLWVSLLCCVTLFAQTGLRISKVEIKNIGPAAASNAMVLANIRVKEGELYQRSRVDEDVKNLYATGYFYNIRIAQENTAEGVKLTYILQGKPTLTDIKFTGNKKYSNKKLLKKISSKTGEPLDDKKLFDDARTIEKLYEKAGYQKTTCKPVLSIDENAGRGTVTFEIHETHKTRIKNITFEGVTGFKDRKLRKVLKTKQAWMFSWLTGSNVYKEEQFEDDKDRLIEFFQNEGYVDAEIKDVKFQNVSPKKMNVVFVIQQGRRYKVGDITIKGNKLFTTNDIIKGIITEAGKPDRMGMLVGSYFTPKGFNQDQEAITDFYGSKGYIDAKINAQKIPNTASGTMDVVFEIEEGDKSYIERIEIKGNEKTKDKVIRRELSVTPGEVFDMVKVKLSKERLEGLQYFEKVDTKPENTDVQNRKNLVVGVEEKNTGSLTFGAGFSSIDAVVGFVEVSQANFDLFKPPTFTGGGQKFRLRAQVGSKRQDYLLSFVEPWFLNRKLALGVDLYHRDLNFVSIEDFYSERHTGATLSLTRALGSELLIGRVAYNIEAAELQLSDAKNIPPEIRSQAGSYFISKFSGSLAYDTRNSYSLPSRGQRTELLSEIAGAGGNVHFFKLEARTAWYFPGFRDGHILEVVGRTGAVQSYGSGDRGTNDVPIFDRWFLGGLYSLRGFRYRDVGPTAGGEALGGDTYWFGSAEYSIPIIERLRFAMFYDVGNVLRNPFSYVPAQQDAKQGQTLINDDYGIGLRINLPIGPLRLDYGIPITHDANTSGAGRFQFGVGYTREF